MYRQSPARAGTLAYLAPGLPVAPPPLPAALALPPVPAGWAAPALLLSAAVALPGAATGAVTGA
ncbi:hypothetical protein, partial [Massilia agilis]